MNTHCQALLQVHVVELKLQKEVAARRYKDVVAAAAAGLETPANELAGATEVPPEGSVQVSIYPVPAILEMCVRTSCSLRNGTYGRVLVLLGSAVATAVTEVHISLAQTVQCCCHICHRHNKAVLMVVLQQHWQRLTPPLMPSGRAMNMSLQTWWQ